MSERSPLPADQPARAAIGLRVRAARSSTGMSLRQLAARLGVSPATVSAIENGQTGLSSVRLTQVAALLDVPVEDLLVDSDERSDRRRPAARRVLAVADDQGHGQPLRLDWRAYPPLSLDPPLAAALSAFLEFGYHGATMRHIAQRAGLSVPGVYHYYASKQEMLVALLDLTMSDLSARSLAARDEGHDPVERFSLLVECLAQFHTQRRELGFVGASEMRSLEPVTRERVAGLRRAQQRLVDDEVGKAAADGTFRTAEPHEAARAVVTMCTALAQWWRPAGPFTPEVVARQYVRFALDLVECTPDAGRARRGD